MKALSIRQPWAWLIVNGYKDIENRTWCTKHRGPLLIHTGQRVDRDGIEWLRRISKANRASRLQRMLTRSKGLPLRLELPNTFPTGGIVGRVTLVDCVTDHPSQCFNGPIGWVLEDPTALDFVPMPGRLGLFDVDLDLIDNTP